MITIRLEYRSVMGEVHRVLSALDDQLGDSGEVWVSPEDAIAGREDSDYEPAQGTALVDVFVDTRSEAHNIVVPALNDADPDQSVIVGGDVVAAPPDRWRSGSR